MIVAAADAPQRHARAPPGRAHPPRELDGAQERALLAAAQVDPHGDLADVRRRALVVVDRGQRVEHVRRRAGGDRVARCRRSPRRRGTRTRSGCRTAPGGSGAGDRDLHAHAAGQPAGRAAQQRARGLGDGERPDERRGRRALGQPIRLSSAARIPDQVCARCRGRWRTRGTGIDGGSAPRAPGDGVGRVVGDRAERVAERGVLVGRRRVGERDRVVDHAVDVGVLQEQPARAGALERVAERPHPVGVGVGDGADRADLDVAAGVATTTTDARAASAAAGRCRAARRARPAPGGRPAGRRARARGRASGETPVTGERRRERLGARRRIRWTAAAARGDAAVPSPASRASGGSGGVPRIASIGVASTTSPPYSPSDSEIAPTLRFVPAPSQ